MFSESELTVLFTFLMGRLHGSNDQEQIVVLSRCELISSGLGRTSSFVWNLILLMCPFRKELIIWEKRFFIFGRTYNLWFSFIARIVECMDNLRTITHEYVNLVPYVSQQSGRTRFPTWNFYNSCILGFPEICYLGTHAFSPGTSLDGPRGQPYCWDFGRLLLKTIIMSLSSPSFSLKGRY